MHRYSATRCTHTALHERLHEAAAVEGGLVVSGLAIAPGRRRTREAEGRSRKALRSIGGQRRSTPQCEGLHGVRSETVEGPRADAARKATNETDGRHGPNQEWATAQIEASPNSKARRCPGRVARLDPRPRRFRGNFLQAGSQLKDFAARRGAVRKSRKRYRRTRCSENSRSRPPPPRTHPSVAPSSPSAP